MALALRKIEDMVWNHSIRIKFHSRSPLKETHAGKASVHCYSCYRFRSMWLDQIDPDIESVRVGSNFLTGAGWGMVLAFAFLIAEASFVAYAMLR